jgi:autonomous glycyl radical cofactor GrcA
MAGRRGSVSTINNFTIEELVSEMLKSPQMLSKIKLYSNNHNMNETTREHATKAFETFKVVRGLLRKKAKIQTAERYEAEKQIRIERWKQNNPNTLRYKSMEEILSVIESDSTIRAKVSSYLSQTNSNLSAEYKKRLRMAMIAYYIKTNPSSPVLIKHVTKLSEEQ